MAEQIFPVEENARIIIRGQGDLNIQGWDRSEIRAVSPSRQLPSLQTRPEEVLVSCVDDCDLEIPAGAQLTIEKAAGDLFVHGLKAAVSIVRVGGDLAVTDVGMLDLQSVGGDAQIHQVAGPLNIQRVGGDLIAGSLNGVVMIAAVNGDLEVQLPACDVNTNARGDVDMAVQALKGQKIALNASGDVNIFLPAPVDADLSLVCGGDIRVERENEATLRADHILNTRLGSGGSRLSIHAGGDIEISDREWDLGHLERSRERIKMHWEGLNGQRRRSSARFSFVIGGADLTDRVNRRVEDRMRHASHRIDEAMRRVEERTRRMEQEGFVPPIPPIPPIPPRPPVPPVSPDPFRQAGQASRVSEEERLLVLRMLQEKKITPEEADRLLQALEK
jgi:hypothetical protein